MVQPYHSALGDVWRRAVVPKSSEDDPPKDEVFVSQTELQKININTAEYDSLKSHPYIKYNVAKSIVNYREQHGAFSEIDQLLKIHLIDDDLLRKLKPYLATEWAILRLAEWIRPIV